MGRSEVRFGSIAGALECPLCGFQRRGLAAVRPFRVDRPLSLLDRYSWSGSKVWDGRLGREIYELRRLVQGVALGPYLARLRRPRRILQESKRPLKFRFGTAAITTSFWLRWKYTR